MTNFLKNRKDEIASLQGIFTVVAICLAGLWFLLRDEMRESIELDGLDIQSACLSSQHQFLLVSVRIRNTGSVETEPKGLMLKVEMVLPQLDGKEASLTPGQKLVDLPLLEDYRPTLDEIRIFPGETHTYSHRMMIDRTAELVLVEAFVALGSLDVSTASSMDIWRRSKLHSISQNPECGKADDKIKLKEKLVQDAEAA